MFKFKFPIRGYTPTRVDLENFRDSFGYTFDQKLDVPGFTDCVDAFHSPCPVPPIYVQESPYTYSGMGSVCRKMIGVHQVSDESLTNNGTPISTKDVTRTFFTCGTCFAKNVPDHEKVAMLHYICLKEVIIRPSWSKWYLDMLEAVHPKVYNQYEELLCTYKTSSGRRENPNTTAKFKHMSDPDEVANIILRDMFGTEMAATAIRDCTATLICDIASVAER